MKTLMIIAVVIGVVVLWVVNDQNTSSLNQMHEASQVNQQVVDVQNNCKRVGNDVVCEVK